MSLFGTNKKTHTTEATTGTSNNTATTTPNVPDWIANPSKTIAGNVTGFLDQGPAAFTPQISGLERGAYDDAANLGAQPNKYFDAASSALSGAGPVTATDATAASLLDGGLDKYYNPFKEQVLNPVLNDYDTNAGMTRAAQAAQAARSGAFQGSRYGIQEGQTEGELARGRAATEGGLLGNMYTSATGLANEDAGRRNTVSLANAAAANAASLSNRDAALEKARQLAGLGVSSGAEDRANLGVRAGLGGLLSDKENAIRNYPMTFAKENEGLLTGLNPELYTGKTLNSSGSTTGTSSGATTSSDPMSDIGKVAQIAAMFAGSDRRIKRDIRTVGWDAKGRRWVTFAYLWAPLRRMFGVIAQEVLKSDPEAVVAGPGGVLMVNYARLR